MFLRFLRRRDANRKADLASCHICEREWKMAERTSGIFGWLTPPPSMKDKIMLLSDPEISFGHMCKICGTVFCDLCFGKMRLWLKIRSLPAICPVCRKNKFFKVSLQDEKPVEDLRAQLGLFGEKIGTLFDEDENS